MPGVPSGRGCNGCRRQKKKCDEARPACSRCARLNIECVGAGQQRYKFHNKTVEITTPATATTTGGCKTSLSPSASSRNSSSRGALVHFTHSPVNAYTIVTSQLVTALKVQDPRFDLSVYGPFLRDIPRRVGNNVALDAAVDAMTTTLPFAQSHDGPTELMFRKNARALQALRACLNNRATASSPDTLCALYLNVVCQGWLHTDDQNFPSHGEAVVHILESMRNRTWEDPFDRSIVTVLCFLVVLEGTVNPRIRIDSDMWNMPETFGPQSPEENANTISSLLNRNLARMVTLIRNPQEHPQEIVQTYYQVRQDRAKIGALMALIPATLAPDGTWVSIQPIAVQQLQVRWNAAFGILTMLCMRLNSVMRSSQGHGVKELDNLNPFDLANDLTEYIDSVIDLSERAVQYRPLGSSSMPFYLLAAYTAIGEAELEKAERIRQIMLKYRPDMDLNTLTFKMQPESSTVRVSYSGGDNDLQSTDYTENTQNEREVKVVWGKSDLCCIL